MMRVLSLGGGTQSCALALMSAAGDLPKLDHVVFADTQGELPETYAYIDYLRPIIEAAGIGFHVVTAGDLYDDFMFKVQGASTPPLHIRNADGSKGRVSKYQCSYTYKRMVIERQVKALVGGRGAWKSQTVEQWIGFSLDEVGRMKPANGCRCGHVASIHRAGCTKCRCAKFVPWQVNRWPLIELGMKRDDTIRWFSEHGHPVPPRSACWFCPNSGNDRWQELDRQHPDLFARVVDLDEALRDGRVPRRGLNGELFMHASLDPMASADLRTKRQIAADEGQRELFDSDVLAFDCSAGVCFT